MTRPSHTTAAHRLWEPSSVVRLRSLTAELSGDLTAARWAPTGLEVRIAGLLLTSAAGDGMLTGPRIRAALWEGSVALTHVNEGRLATLLASLVPVADEPDLYDPALVAGIRELLTRVAERHSAPAGHQSQPPPQPAAGTGEEPWPRTCP